VEKEKLNILTHKKQSKAIGIFSLISFTLIISTIIAVSASVISVYYYHKNYAFKIIAVDLAGFVESQKESFVSGKVDENWLIRKKEELTNYLKKLPQNTLLLTSDVVLSDYPVDKSIPVIKFNTETQRWVITYVE
jgi:hypothetical protein